VKAVILINFGGPRSKDEIRPFLRDVFNDVLPRPLKFLAPLLARLREKKSARMYDTIGGISPVVGWTRWQAVELENRLNAFPLLCKEGLGEVETLPHPSPPLTKGREIRVYIGMKYGRPSIEDAVAEAKGDGAEEIILLPLFPYHSKYTAVAFSSHHLTISLSHKTWHNHPLYISAMVSIIKTALAKWQDIPPTKIDLIFSVHAIPRSTARKEPYVREVEESVALIMRQFTGYNHTIAYQSATGPLRWTKPSVKQILTQTLKNSKTLASMPEAGQAQKLLIPLGFACENIETLYELDKLYKASRTPCLNDNPQFIDLAKELVLNARL